MITVQAPTIWMYGGIHDDPGSRQRFLEELGKRETAPHFVAVEWEQSVFERLAARRPWIAENLKLCLAFLTREDCHELSRALAWEGDAYVERFPATDLLWLENGFQDADLERRFGTDASKFPQSCADGLVRQFYEPMIKSAPLPEPRSKTDLIARVWRIVWARVDREPGGIDRDARWAKAIYERSSGLCDGWIAVVTGWAHADPNEGSQRLRGLLVSRGFCVNSVRLGP